ncbi:hypothetical protein KP806_16915 [Paenibacillus sp. N4]|uniref:hypothetical protein n=1 Tax=Paenibacillus vietnamensis TaxID=2590547 RepID=UPI001CD18A57|nr:hypothetical protein [Paenibacillus vietnamensis]MCA0756740.1 hypothetical protein [Paenibacillus vietnamensis]
MESSQACIIGEHMFCISFETESVKRLFRHTFPTVLPGSGCEPAFRLLLKEGYGRPFTDYRIDKFAVDGGFRYLRTDYALEVRANYQSAVIHVHDSLALKHAFMHLYSLLIVHERWGLLLHSSCVAENGKAYLFTGHSGAGKSTAAALSLPRSVIADEAAIVRIRPSGVSVFHSPFRSELQSMDGKGTGSWPLGGVHLLHQAQRNRLQLLSKSEGLLRLPDKVFFWNPSVDESRAIIHLLKQAVELVPLYELHFRKDPEFWELIS